MIHHFRPLYLIFCAGHTLTKNTPSISRVCTGAHASRETTKELYPSLYWRVKCKSDRYRPLLLAGVAVLRMISLLSLLLSCLAVRLCASFLYFGACGN